MPKAVSILLAIVLLACPYFCLDGQVAGGFCPHGDCDDGCRLDDQHETASPHSCGDCVHEVEAGPVDHPVDDSRRSSQCLCQGAVTCGELRLADVRVLHVVGYVDALPHSATENSARPACTVDDFSNRHSAGRGLCVRVCALLI